MTKIEQNKAILEALTTSAEIFENANFIELLMIVKIIPVDVPIGTHVFDYIKALKEDDNQNIMSRFHNVLNRIVDDHQRKEKGTSD